MPSPRKQIRLAAHFPGVNTTTVWRDPASGSQIDFSSFEHLARTAERGLFDALFLAEGLSLREHAGHVHDLDVAGRPDSFTVLAAVAAVTEHLGLMATITTTYHEPWETARQLASLDHLSAGRAAWNLVTSTDAVSGANFRRGAYLPYADRYARATDVLEVAHAVWSTPVGGRVEVHGPQADLAGTVVTPPPPQGRPVMIQAGDSSDGREFAARHADGIFTRHGSLEQGRAFYADVKGRLATYGRRPEDLLVLPGATFVLADTDAEAQERAADIRRQQVSGPTAIVVLEQLWNRDLSQHDPDGPLPTLDPIEGEPTIAPGSIPARMYTGRRQETADEWRAEAAADGLSIRDLAVRKAARQAFVGSPETVAAQMDEHVQGDACDGYVLVPHLTPGGFDEFVDRVIPLLQERGSFRTAYEGSTLRENLGLRTP